MCRAAHVTLFQTCIDEVEMDALEQGLIIACKYGSRSMIVNVDSSIAIHYVRMVKTQWHVSRRVKRIKSMMNSIQDCIL